jgi:hypothetical protein
MATESATIAARLRPFTWLLAATVGLAVAGWALLSLPAAQAAGDCAVSASETANRARAWPTAATTSA